MVQSEAFPKCDKVPTLDFMTAYYFVNVFPCNKVNISLQDPIYVGTTSLHKYPINTTVECLSVVETSLMPRKEEE